MEKIKSNISDYSVTFYILHNARIALSELSFIDKEMAISYLDIVKNDEQKTSIVQTLEQSSGLLFYNRLNVPESLRGQGLGKELLRETLEFCKKNNYMLFNFANNYGEMGQNKLIEFYEKNGMTLIQEEGFLVYHDSLSYKNKKGHKL